ncbi:MAG: ABC transporter permease [Xanthomonadales bacterium]|nr:ABC transporter permease [Xanthomonadales bacterium]
MSLARFTARRLLAGIPLLLGVTFVSFLLMVHFGPDRTYELLGKNPTPEQIASVRAELGYDRPFLLRYADYLRELATLDLGHSDATGEPVAALIARTLPVTLALVLPGFVLGNLLGVLLGLWASARRGRWVDRVIMGASVAGMSLSFLVIIIALQVLLCTPHGLNWFPARGWDMGSLPAYLEHVTVPTLALVLITLGYNTRFYRAVLVEEWGRDHVLAARAFGASPAELTFGHVLRNALVPILTRAVFSIPVVVISGSLLLESFFGIPGVGRAAYDAIGGGDQPVLKAVVGLAAVAFVLLQLVTDVINRATDPRVAGP